MKCKKLLPTLLATAMIISSFAALPITANAATTKKTMNMGSSVIAKDDNICYGYNNGAKKWRVLSTNGNTTDGETTFNDGAVSKDKALFVISENDFGKRAFNSNNNQNWQGSEAQKWCNNGGFYTAAGITDTEKAAILQTSKSDKAYSSYKAADKILENDKVFYLSAKEADTYFNKESGIIDEDRKFTPGGGNAVDWWLRSPLISNDKVVCSVDIGGSFAPTTAFSSFIVSRPAFNLNLSSVIFTSAAEGDKSSIGNYGGNEWKLTLKDNNRNSFAASCTSKDGNKIQISYSGAKTGTNEKISYVITDKDNNITYYGNQEATSESGEIVIDISAMAAGDRLFVFNEQTNGDYKTDYASELKEVAIPLMIAASANDSTMGNVTSSKAIAYVGESVTLTATAKEGYKLVGFESDDVEKLWILGNECMFTMPYKDVTVKANFTPVGASEITVKNSEAFDLDGKEITASKIVVENGGKIKDSTGGKGILKVASGELYGRNYTDQFPLYDEQNGGWRFFDCEIGAGYIEGDSSIIGTTLKFKDAETEAIAKRILASDNPGVSLDITLSKTDENGVEHIQTAKAPQGMIKSYAEDLTKPILMGVSGLKPGMTISVNYRFANGLVISKEVSGATPYITLEAGADKNYIVKVYGTGLDGVVAVALYNSENQSQLIDVKIQKVAEISGQLQGNGEFVKAMLWSDLDTMKPLCDAVGKDLTITE